MPCSLYNYTQTFLPGSQFPELGNFLAFFPREAFYYREIATESNNCRASQAEKICLLFDQ